MFRIAPLMTFVLLSINTIAAQELPEAFPVEVFKADGGVSMDVTWLGFDPEGKHLLVRIARALRVKSLVDGTWADARIRGPRVFLSDSRGGDVARVELPMAIQLGQAAPWAAGLKGECTGVDFVAWTAKGELVTMAENVIQKWNVTKIKEIGKPIVLPGTTRKSLNARFEIDPTGQPVMGGPLTLFSLSPNGKILLGDLARSPEEILRMPPDRRLIQTFSFFNSERGASNGKVMQFPKLSVSIGYTDDGTKMLMFGAGGSLNLFDCVKGIQLKSEPGLDKPDTPIDQPRRYDFGRNQKVVIAGPRAALFDTKAKKVLAVFTDRSLERNLEPLAISPDGTLVATSNNGLHRIEITEALGGRIVAHSQAMPNEDFGTLVFSDDGRFLVSVTKFRSKVQAWDASAARSRLDDLAAKPVEVKLLGRVDKPNESNSLNKISAIAFSRDGGRMAIATSYAFGVCRLQICELPKKE